MNEGMKALGFLVAVNMTIKVNSDDTLPQEIKDEVNDRAEIIILGGGDVLSDEIDRLLYADMLDGNIPIEVVHIQGKGSLEKLANQAQVVASTMKEFSDARYVNNKIFLDEKEKRVETRFDLQQHTKRFDSKTKTAIKRYCR